MRIDSIIHLLEIFAPPKLQESYDNAGLLTGNREWECTGVVVALDATEAVVLEAKTANCNLVIAHHPIIFNGLKKITGDNYVEQTIIQAIKNDIAIFAIHTNLDNVSHGVNKMIADAIHLNHQRILAPKNGMLNKLHTFVPVEFAATVREAIFKAGGGVIGNYSECSFNIDGTGTFKGNETTDPFVGEPGKQHAENETKIEVIFPLYAGKQIINALKQAHPYQEVAYDIVSLQNEHQYIGAGIVGELPEAISEHDFLCLLKSAFNLKIIRHSPLFNKSVKKIAVCGGSGSFLTRKAIESQADFFVSADFKYHEFFDADGKIVLADIGHWESEQFTIDLIYEHLRHNFPNFAVLKSGKDTNPVRYFI